MIYFLAIAPVFGLASYIVYAAAKWRREALAARKELAKANREMELKSAELELAKHELAKFTSFLEQRIDQRTVELREAQDQIRRLTQGK